MAKTAEATLQRPSVARERLAATLAERNAALSALNEAEEAHQVASQDHWRAQGAIVDIDDRIKKIVETRTYTWQQRAEVEDRIAAERALMPAAKLHLRPLAAAEELAKARVTDAEWRVTTATHKLNEAADDVIREVAAPTADALIKRIAEAMNILVMDGPQLEWLLQAGMLSGATGATAKATVSAFYVNVAGWSGYDYLRRANPWQAMRECLKANPDTPLPSA